LSKSSNLAGRLLMVAVMTCMFVAGAPASGFAHARLLTSVPAAESAVKRAPTELRLSFSERIELTFTKVTLTGGNRQEIELGSAVLDPRDNKVLVILIKVPLPPGSYTVNWSVVSADGHKSKGTFGFDNDQ
jgi:methionine-rich copper-binding protein CopC